MAGTFSPWPVFGPDEIDAVGEVLASGDVNYWTGTQARAFEREYAAWTGNSHAIALMNGTVALDLALRVLGVGAGDEVVVTPRTFLASVSCVVNAGATPVFAEVDADSGNITPESVAAVLSPRTKAIIPVHLAGWPCEMDGLLALGIPIIEDCAQAHGARYRGRSVGSIGAVGAWSFCQDKIITTGGEGGMVTTNDESLWSAMWSFKDHGKSWDAVYNREHPPGFRWLHESFGTNWRITEMQAAIGRVQLKRMEDWHRVRTRNTLRVADAAASCSGLRVPLPAAHLEHAWYKLYAYVRPESLKAGWDRDRIMAAIKEAGVPCFSGSCSEVYL